MRPKASSKGQSGRADKLTTYAGLVPFCCTSTTTLAFYGGDGDSGGGGALWSGTNKNRDASTGPLARPFARSLALLTRSLAPDCSLRSRLPLRSLICSLAHSAHSLARGRVNY